jgi:minor extracellular serine protease Vpr
MNKFRISQTIILGLLLVVFTASTVSWGVEAKESKPHIPQELEHYASDTDKLHLMVELKSPPLSVFSQKVKDQLFASYRKDLYSKMLDKERAQVLNDLKKRSSECQVKFEYKVLFHGFSLSTDSAGFSFLSTHPEVAQIYGLNEYYQHREYSVPAVSAPEIWDLVDSKGQPLKGKDMLVGIIDTGIDYWHGDLGGGFGKKADGTYYKVRGGFDFADMNPIPNDGNLSFHGTHVAGIVAGIGEAGVATGSPIARGVAPEASLMAYKVFASGRRSTGGDAIAMALEQAVIDGCDVVNLSLGKFFGWTEDPLSLLCDRASDAGVIVVASAGNDGLRNSEVNLFPIASPSSGLNVISVASSDETLKPSFVLELSNNEKAGSFPGQMLVYSPPLLEKQHLPCILLDGYGMEEDFETMEVEGKVVLLKRGGNSFREKTLNAMKAGAIALIIINNVPGLFGGTLGEAGDYIPVMAISKEDGDIIAQLLETCPNSTLNFSYAQLATMSSFSSQGPSPDYYLKPDMTAPGSAVLSSAPNQSYAYASGTSMSAPHVAGGAALMKQLHPGWTPKEIKSLLANYSDILLEPQTQKPISVYRQGAGRMNLLRSSQASVISDPVSLSYFYVKENTSPESTFTLSNKGEASVKLSFETQTDHPAYQIEITPTNINLAPGDSINISTRLKVAEDQDLEPGRREFRIKVSYDQQQMSIPGIFHYGEETPMDLTLRAFSYPTLALSPNDDGSGDQNYFYFMSPHLIDGIQVNLYDHSATQNLGVLSYVRARMGAGYFRVTFSGKLMGRDLADGMYTFKSFILPKGADYLDKNQWKEGKSSKVLIDRVPPELNLNMTKKDRNQIEIEGKIEDNEASLGVFLYYEIDDEIFDMVQLEPDRSFKATIPVSEDNFFIRFTAQDLAGNTTKLKRRIP